MEARMPEKLAKELEALDVECRPVGEFGKFQFYHQGKPLKTFWSPAVVDDLRASHGMDAEVELIDIVLAEIRHAILGTPL